MTEKKVQTATPTPHALVHLIALGAALWLCVSPTLFDEADQ